MNENCMMNELNQNIKNIFDCPSIISQNFFIIKIIKNIN